MSESHESEKNERTQRVRDAMRSVVEAVETDGAEPDMAALSYASRPYPGRSVWIETNRPEGLRIDLEDEREANSFDHSTARMVIDTEGAMVTVARIWLGGGTVEDALAAAGGHARRR